jgi:hypothetical protein
MQKREEVRGKHAAPPVYEVGCAAVFLPEKADGEGNPLPPEPHPPTRARHWTLEGAKGKWNKGELLSE